MILTKNNGASYSGGEVINSIEELRLTSADQVNSDVIYSFEMDENLENLLIVQCKATFICRNMPMIDLTIRQSYELSMLKTSPEFNNLKEVIEDAFIILSDYFKERNSVYKIPHEITPLTYEEVAEAATRLSVLLHSEQDI